MMSLVLLTCMTSLVCAMGLVCLYACHVRRRGARDDALLAHDDGGDLDYNVVGDTVVM